MGLTPLEGLMMGTRCGDIDPSIHHYLLERGYDEKYIATMLTKKAGLVGISGKGDFRDVCDGHAKGDASCTLAFHMYCYRVLKYVGAYMAVLGGRVDAIVFTAGVGENSSRMTRLRVCVLFIIYMLVQQRHVLLGGYESIDMFLLQGIWARKVGVI